MDAPLLATKLHAPAPRPGAVDRARLTDRMNRTTRLALVTAPAGFGKSTVVTQWLAASDTAVAWVSLDARENDGAQFWHYLFAALNSAIPGVSDAAVTALDGAPVEAALSAVLNDLVDAGSALVIVLDDYHVIENPSVHAGLTFLIDHLPPSVRIVIVSRADPPLPLGRLRAQGDLVELRAADLRFTAHEASDYLNVSMGLGLERADVERLGERTEGWIAALQLAALSLQDSADPAGFIASFAGDDRYVVDYLVEEVLQQQTEQTRRFLLHTSILDRLRGDLCDAVTGAHDSATTLDALDRMNLLVIPLDDQGGWYRYHHLFAEMLHARLLDEHGDEVVGLHRRASEWFQAQGETADAIGHALEAADFERAARLIKDAAPAMQQRRQEPTLASWLDRLPAELSESDPALALVHAGVLLSSGRTDGVDRLLSAAEAAIGEPAPEVAALRRGVALYRSARALTEGDTAAADRASQVAVRLAEDGTHLDRGSAHGIRGLIRWAAGDLAGAHAAWVRSLDELESAGHVADVLGGSIALGDILIAQGRLGGAEAVYRRGLALGATADPPLRGTADMHVALADLVRERGDLAGARRELDAAEALGEYAGLPQNRHRKRMAAARLLRSEGDPAAGIPLLEEAERVYTPDFFPEVRPIAAMRARLAIAAGRLGDAQDWARRRAVRKDDDLSYLTEYDHITLARLLVAETDPAAIALLDRLLDAAEAGERIGAVIELLTIRALALQEASDAEAAIADILRAVALAEREGYERVFADEGPALARLLTAAARRDGDTATLRRLRAAASGAGPAGPARGLTDPLSERELEVLRLLGSELSGPEIARHLVVSLNTVRTHTKNIYAKLGASSRRQAVARAAELGLLRSPR